jgi:signal transduction histidine kinase/streptogramin lyase
MEDNKGNFWVGTAHNGVHLMDREKGTFKRYLHLPTQSENVARPIVQEGGLDDHITFIHEDSAGGIWIGSFLSGLYRYDPKTKKVAHFESEKYSLTGPGEPGPWQCFSSREGVVWISTWESTLFRIDPFRKSIPHVFTGSPVFAFHQETNGELWVGTANGLLRIDPKGKKKRFVFDAKDTSSLIDNVVLALYKDKQGVLWIATRFGLNRYDKKNNNFTRFQHDPQNSTSLSSGEIHRMIEDRRGNFWIGTTDGLNLLNRKTEKFIHLRNNPKDTNSLSQNFITDLQEDQHGNLWVGNWNTGGINRLQNGKFKHYLPGASVICIYEDSAGVIWAGTEDGLYFKNDTTDKFSRFIDLSTGLGPVNVASILEDKKKSLWVSTFAGVLKINRGRTETSIYGVTHGINPTNVNYLAGYEGPTGQLFFGEVTGYYAFFPQQILSNNKPPQVVLTDFSLADHPIKLGKGGILTKPLIQTKEIRLKYNQNVFSLSFAGIHYSSPEYNRHIFMLENYDHTWRQSGAERTAYYFNIPPGKYIFRVKAASSDGIWGEKTISITITPPLWRSWWAYGLYVLGFLVMLYAIDRILRMRVIQKERKRIRDHELSQAREIQRAYLELKRTQDQLVHSEKMASLGELTAGIAHEIQNPLNFVNNFSEVSVELIDDMEREIEYGDKEDAVAIAVGLKENLKKIINHGKRADSIVKGMLQHTRGSSGEKQLTDVNALAEEYLRLSYHGLRAKDKSFNAILETHLDPGVDKINVVPQDIGRVFLNLYNNAFYSMQQKKQLILNGYQPVVSVSTAQKEGNVEIRVRDNGIGISAKMLDKVFQPFFTTKPSGQGTGLGLSLSYDIITKGHGGEMKVETKEGEFAEFIITVPEY